MKRKALLTVTVALLALSTFHAQAQTNGRTTADIVQQFDAEKIKNRAGRILITPGFTTTIELDIPIVRAISGKPSMLEANVPEQAPNKIELRAGVGVNKGQADLKITTENGDDLFFIFDISTSNAPTPRLYRVISNTTRSYDQVDSTPYVDPEQGTAPKPAADKKTVSAKAVDMVLGSKVKEKQQVPSTATLTPVPGNTSTLPQPGDTPTNLMSVSGAASTAKSTEAVWLNLTLQSVTDPAGNTSVFYSFTNHGESVVSINPADLVLKANAQDVKFTVTSTRQGVIKVNPKEGVQGIINVQNTGKSKIFLGWKVQNLSTGEAYDYVREFEAK